MVELAYNASELALAAYANLFPGKTADQLDALTANNNMSAYQAQDFALRYPTIVAQINDTATSFSATVVADASGNLALAIRGTLEAGDFVPTDVNIAVNGAGYDQIAALYNTWQRLTHRQGETITVYRVDLTDPMSPLVAESMVNDLGSPSAPLISPGAAVDVTGHSLGGHLALAFAGLFPINARQVFAFNAPGFIDSPQNRNFFAQLGGALPTGVAPSGVPTVNVIADGASGADVSWRGIAGLHSRPGTPIDIAIENQATGDEPIATRPGALNHSQMVLTDALAVYALLAQLDPGLSVSDYERLLAVAAPGTAASLERTVDALQRQLNNDGALLPVGNGADRRDALYQAIYGLRADANFGALAGKLTLAPLSANFAASVGAGAKTDFGQFVALKTLSPFALRPKAGVAGAQAALDGVWRSVHAADHAAWTADRSARLYGDPSHELAFTDAWYADRAAMLNLRSSSARTTVMPVDPAILAHLSASAYRNVTERNRIFAPAGWEQIATFPASGPSDDPVTGFSAAAYRGPGGEIVIAYAGTNRGYVRDFAFGNVAAALGEYSPQAQARP
jgi:hypothetical protein